MTVTRELKVEVSGRIREEFSNGKEYYFYHGKNLTLPGVSSGRPDPTYIDWHNSNVFKP
jgi:putative restriction endonuclease